MEYDIIIEPDHLRVEVSGPETTDDAERLLHAVSEVIFKFGRMPILISSRNASPLSLPDLYALARCTIITPLRHCRIALLHDLDAALEASQFVQALGQDRGLELAVFRTASEAIRWLTPDRGTG